MGANYARSVQHLQRRQQPGMQAAAGRALDGRQGTVHACLPGAGRKAEACTPRHTRSWTTQDREAPPLAAVLPLPGAVPRVDKQRRRTWHMLPSTQGMLARQ